MIVSQFRDFILIPTLEMIDLYSKQAEILMIGTGLVESNFDYIKQIGTVKAGGYGFFQCENATYLDCVRYLKFNKRLGDRVLAACSIEYFPPSVEPLMWNLRLSVCFARVKYFMQPKALPKKDDAAGFAQYHKKYYNGRGKTDVNESVKIFQAVMDNKY